MSRFFDHSRGRQTDLRDIVPHELARAVQRPQRHHFDCSTIRADPGDDWSLRGHTGRHYKMVERIVDHPDFVGMNMPLQDIRDDQKSLVNNACVHCRHRSVANKECQFKGFHSRRYDGKRGNIEMIDLQAGKHWKHLCAPDCVDWDMKSHRFLDALIRGGDLLQTLIRKRKSEAVQSSRRSDPPPRTGLQIERVQQLKLRSQGKEELDKKGEELKQKLKDKGFGPKF